MFQGPLALVITGLYQTLWRSGQNTKEQDPYDSLDRTPPDTMPGARTPIFNVSTLVQLSLLVTAFTLPLTAFRVVGGLDTPDAFVLTMILGFMACSVKLATLLIESLREEVKTGSDCGEEGGMWEGGMCRGIRAEDPDDG